MMKRRLRLLAVPLVLASVLSAPATQALYSEHPQVVHADPGDSTPHIVSAVFFLGETRAKVNAILPMGDRIYVGGTFKQVKNDGTSAVIERHGLFALDAATHRVVPDFVADVDAAVEALAPSPDGKALFVAGKFTTVNGLDFPKLAKVDATTGAPVAGFRPRPSAEVKDIAVSGDRVFLAGPFATVRSVARIGLAAVDVETGAVDSDVNVAFTEPRQGVSPRVESIAVTPDGKTLVAGGNFTKAGGQERWQVALLDVTDGRSASVLNWQTNRFDDRKSDPRDPYACAEAFDTHVKDMDMSPDGSYFVVVTTGGYTSRGPLCDTASRWETAARGTALQPTWASYDGGDSYTGVAITGAAVYVSGHMRWLNNFYNQGSSTDAQPGPGSIPREGIAALDPASGLPLPWNPGRERGHGAEALASAKDGLWVGSDTDAIGGEHHPRLAFFPLAGGSPVASYATQGLPGDLYSVGLTGGISRRFFDGQRVGAPTSLSTSAEWSKVRGAFAVNGRLYTGHSGGDLLAYPFDGSTLGAPAEVNMRGLTSSHFPVGNITGMFYDKGKIYYTLDGDRELHYRSYLVGATVADDIVGDQQLDADGAGSIDWSDVEGMTLAGGKIYWAEGAELKSVAFANGSTTGSEQVVASNVGLASRGLFLMPQTTTPPSGSIDPPATVDPGPGPAPGPGRSGYWMVGSDGRVYAFGSSAHLGDAAAHLGGASAVDLEPTPSFNGYWIVDDLGRVFTFGDARYHGNVDRAQMARDERVTSLSATPNGDGYWIFTSLGRVIPFGDAQHVGDMAGVALNGPVLDSIPTPSGQGYYMVASDGGIFTFGDAVFYGSMGDVKLNAPVQSLVPDPDEKGYWLVASDGGVFTFETVFRGSMGAVRLNKPMTGMVPFGDAYLMVAEDGGIFNFASDKEFFGSLGANPPAHPIVSVAALDE